MRVRRAPSGAQGVCKIAISSKKLQKIGRNPDFGPKFGHFPDWPDPAITYYKCLRGFFSHNFSGMKGNFQDRNECT